MDGGTDGCNLVVFLYYILIVILMAPSLSENKHASKYGSRNFTCCIMPINEPKLIKKWNLK